MPQNRLPGGRVRSLLRLILAVSSGASFTVALAAIRLPEAEVHLRVAHRSYPAAEWAARLDTTSDGGPGWRDYLDEMYQYVLVQRLLGQRGVLDVFPVPDVMHFPDGKPSLHFADSPALPSFNV